jgi:UDP-glucose 4-epimerase
MKKTILLTWGTGFIGSHLLERLCFEWHTVFLLTQESSQPYRITHLEGQYTPVYFSDLSTVFELQKIDIVIHLATCYKKEHSAEDIEHMIYANITLPTKILELCKQYSVKNFINTGTFFEYDLTVSEFTEATQEQAYNLYASMKIAFNSILRFYVKVHHMNIVTLRIFSPYWPKDNTKIIPILIQWLLHDREVSLQDTSSILHFTYVSDIVEAYMSTIKYLSTNTSSWYEIINIGSKDSYSIQEVCNLLEVISSKKIQRAMMLPYQIRMKSICNIEKAQKILDWNSTTSLEEWLRLTYNAYKDAIHTNNAPMSL